MSVLEYMTRLTDHEIKNDLDCVLDALAEAEHDAAKWYRAFRMRAPGFLPGKPGANNHRNIHTQRRAGDGDRACACGCGLALPKFADRRRKFHSDACRKRSLRSPQVDSYGQNAVYDESPSGASLVRELWPHTDVSVGRFSYCPHRSDHAACVPCHIRVEAAKPSLSREAAR